MIMIDRLINSYYTPDHVLNYIKSLKEVKVTASSVVVQKDGSPFRNFFYLIQDPEVLLLDDKIVDGKIVRGILFNDVINMLESPELCPDFLQKYIFSVNQKVGDGFLWDRYFESLEMFIDQMIDHQQNMFLNQQKKRLELSNCSLCLKHKAL